MSMRINTNLDALNAQRNLATTGLAYSKSVAKLSSGMRINTAADDAAGLTISEKLRAQTAGLAQASRNAQDGISLIQTGEGALNETASILQRMRELTVQGGNDTLQASDRGAIKSEVDQLSSEINRISNTTQFNGKTLLNGSLSAKGTVSNIVNSGASSLTPAFLTALGQGTQTVASTLTTATTAGVTSSKNTGITAGPGGTLIVNGINVALSANAAVASTASVRDAINNTNGLGANGAVTASLDATNNLVLTSNTVGSGGRVAVAASGAANTILADLGLTAGSVSGLDAQSTSAAAGTYSVKITQGATNAVSTGTKAWAAGMNTAITINGTTVDLTTATDMASSVVLINAQMVKMGVAVTASESGTLVLSATDKLGASSNITVDSAGGTNFLLSNSKGLDAAGTYTAPGESTGVAFSASNGTQLIAGGLHIDTSTLASTAFATQNSFSFALTNSSANLQIGANSGQTLSVGIEDMSATALGVGNLDVSSSTNINAAGTGTLAKIDLAIANVSSQRATLGAYQNRLEHTISNLGVSQSNLTASESRIRDVDMAAEMVNFTKTGILQQAGQAILAQANQSGSGVMSLLR